MSTLRRCSILALALAASCDGSSRPVPVTITPVVSVASASASAAPEPPPNERAELLARMTRKLEAALAKVSVRRGLPIKEKVALEVLDRPDILAFMKKKAETDLPPGLIQDQGEMLVAFELVEPGYDFVNGAFELEKDAIAGFYDPDTKKMYLASDLDDANADETLDHELVHALQDQSFNLVGRLKYKNLEGDRIGAFHALAEGDATIAMLLAAGRDADRVDPKELKFALRAGIRLQTFGKGIPFVLRESLITPYTDGFALVQGLRKRGGWAAVDALYKTPPATTEQALHLDKYDKREAAVAIGELPKGPFSDWKVAAEDAFGEQGLRIAFEDRASETRAAQAAAGWGGDRWVLLAKGDPGARSLVVGWKLVMDTAADAREVATLLGERYGASCVVRPTHGPIAWRQAGTTLAMVAGPFTRKDAKTIAPGPAGCKEATSWVQAILKQK